MKRALITGSNGLIGSEAVVYFDARGWKVNGVDNNMRRDFFGADGDGSRNRQRICGCTRNFTHHELKPDMIIHAAAQPSHELAKDRPFDDFEINAVGTLNLLEAARRYCTDSPFMFMSTNKVYGDAPNEKPLKELKTRWDYAEKADYDGIDETCRVDSTLHSLFGASKLSADVVVQEYGRYFNMPTVCLRGGCLTGPNHCGVELHGFLAYLAHAIKEGRTYRIFGYKGKQVRDNIHALDVCTFFESFFNKPKSAAVYNFGGGRQNSVSILEAIARLEEMIGKKLTVEYCETNRVGDHICYISNLGRIRSDYPEWDITVSLEDIFRQLVGNRGES